MKTPTSSANYHKEREGVLKVALELNRYGYIFRETPNGDIGIDGQVEHVSDLGQVTGKIIAAQIKSGSSYLTDKGDHFAFYPKEKHKNYWVNFPLPVLLFVYYPADEKIYFTDVRYQLSIPEKERNYIRLDKNSFLDEVNSSKIFESVGEFGIPYYPIDKVFNMMSNTVCPNPTFSISYLDLFTQGLTNICRHVYFGMDLAMEIAEYNNRTDFGMCLGYDEHEFLHNYAKFIMSQNLANINYSDYLIDWKERELQPTFIAPINNRGRELLEHIKSIESKYKEQLPPTTLVRERLIRMTFFSHDNQLRLELGQELRKLTKNTKA